MLITILTPTFNRARFLPQIYRSLCRQHCRDFEWLVIDDGSTDDTEATCAALPAADFPICYIRKENGGKHTAINAGVKVAHGELTLILDSDDELPADALAIIANQWNDTANKEELGGLCGYMAHRDGSVIGRPRIEAQCTSIDLRYRYGVTGDMCEIYKASVLREFPFPEYPGERFVPEALVWNRIACKYKLKVFGQVVYLRDYLDGGLTSKIVEIRHNSPKATCRCYLEMMQLDIPFKYKLKALLNYIRFKQRIIKI